MIPNFSKVFIALLCEIKILISTFVSVILFQLVWYFKIISRFGAKIVCSLFAVDLLTRSTNRIFEKLLVIKITGDSFFAEFFFFIKMILRNLEGR